MYSLDKSHAPRERVSWNCQRNLQFHQRPVTLHVSVWVEMILITALGLFFCGHAPRERVSWNPMNVPIRDSTAVTLHVSVWVEIAVLIEIEPLLACHAPRERVSWNAELIHKIRKHFSHAPRERVSWNHYRNKCIHLTKVTLHVSVWVEMTNSNGKPFLFTGHAPRERVSWNLLYFS